MSSPPPHYSKHYSNNASVTVQAGSSVTASLVYVQRSERLTTFAGWGRLVGRGQYVNNLNKGKKERKKKRGYGVGLSRRVPKSKRSHESKRRGWLRQSRRALSRDSLCSSRAAALFLLTLLTQLSLRRSIPSISLFTMLLRRRCPTSPPLFLRFRSLSSSRRIRTCFCFQCRSHRFVPGNHGQRRPVRKLSTEAEASPAVQ